MPNVKTLGEWSSEITPAQREKALELITADEMLGNVPALRQVGVVGSKGHIRDLAAETDFDSDARTIRDPRQDVMALRRRLMDRIYDNDNPFDRGLVYALDAWDDGFNREKRVAVDVQHGGSVTVEHERRLTLADVLSLARSLDGLGTGAGGVLPSSREVLAELVEGQRAAGALPSGSGT